MIKPAKRPRRSSRKISGRTPLVNRENRSSSARQSSLHRACGGLFRTRNDARFVTAPLSANTTASRRNRTTACSARCSLRVRDCSRCRRRSKVTQFRAILQTGDRHRTRVWPRPSGKTVTYREHAARSRPSGKGGASATPSDQGGGSGFRRKRGSLTPHIAIHRSSARHPPRQRAPRRSRSRAKRNASTDNQLRLVADVDAPGGGIAQPAAIVTA